MSQLNVVKRLKEIQKKIEELSSKQTVVGAIGGEVREDGLTNADLLAIHEFGAIINHPGGTSYGYRTERDAKNGKSRFLASGQGFMVTGKTGAHQIIIPERPVLRTTISNNKQAIINALSQGISECLRGNLSVDEAYNQVGAVVKNAVLDNFDSSGLKPNKQSTIRKKKSSKVLRDTGALRASISYEVRNRE